MRLLHVMHGAAQGGAELFFETLAIALQERAAADDVQQHALITPHADRMQRLRDAGCSVEGYGFPPPWSPLGRLKVGAVARRHRPDVILTYMNRAAAAVPKALRPKAVAKFGGFYKLKNYTGFGHMIAIQPKIADHILAGGWPADRVHLIPNFCRLDDSPTIPRAEFDTPEGVPLVVALGRLHRVKAFDVLLQAMTRLPDAWLWLAGTGPEEEALKALAADLGLMDRVRFLGWRTDRRGLLSAGDVCAFPSRYEPNGNVVHEAWSAGVPLVTTTADGPDWLVDHQVNGLKAPVDDAVALADALGQVLADPAAAAALAEAGRSKLDRELSEEAVVDQYLDCLRKISHS